MALVVSRLGLYPVKSCRGAWVEELLVEPWGPAGDRRWMVADPEGTFLTARTLPRLLLIHPEPRPGELILRAPGMPDLVVPEPIGEPLADVVVWRDRIKATPAGAADWLTRFLGTPAQLVHLDDPTRRPVDPEYGAPGDTVSFADGYPLLLTTDASLDAVNALIAKGAGGEGPVDMIRFRPNVAVAGSAPWAEDGWTRLRIGAARFRAVKSCGRCVITTVDPDTGVKGREPLATLAQHRRIGSKLVFGRNLVPDTPGVRIRVGDEVEPLG